MWYVKSAPVICDISARRIRPLRKHHKTKTKIERGRGGRKEEKRKKNKRKEERRWMDTYLGRDAHLLLFLCCNEPVSNVFAYVAFNSPSEDDVACVGEIRGEKTHAFSLI